MLIGPMLSGDNPGKIGGAAGNRTRVQSAYFARVYLHSRANPTLSNIGAKGYDLKVFQGATIREARTDRRFSANRRGSFASGLTAQNLPPLAFGASQFPLRSVP